MDARLGRGDVLVGLQVERAVAPVRGDGDAGPVVVVGECEVHGPVVVEVGRRDGRRDVHRRGREAPARFDARCEQGGVARVRKPRQPAAVFGAEVGKGDKVGPPVARHVRREQAEGPVGRRQLGREFRKRPGAIVGKRVDPAAVVVRDRQVDPAGAVEIADRFGVIIPGPRVVHDFHERAECADPGAGQVADSVPRRERRDEIDEPVAGHVDRLDPPGVHARVRRPHRVKRSVAVSEPNEELIRAEVAGLGVRHGREIGLSVAVEIRGYERRDRSAILARIVHGRANRHKHGLAEPAIAVVQRDRDGPRPRRARDCCVHDVIRRGEVEGPVAVEIRLGDGVESLEIVGVHEVREAYLNIRTRPEMPASRFRDAKADCLRARADSRQILPAGVRRHGPEIAGGHADGRRTGCPRFDLPHAVHDRVRRRRVREHGRAVRPVVANHDDPRLLDGQPEGVRRPDAKRRRTYVRGGRRPREPARRAVQCRPGGAFENAVRDGVAVRVCRDEIRHVRQSGRAFGPGRGGKGGRPVRRGQHCDVVREAFAIRVRESHWPRGRDRPGRERSVRQLQRECVIRPTVGQVAVRVDRGRGRVREIADGDDHGAADRVRARVAQAQVGRQHRPVFRKCRSAVVESYARRDVRK